MVLENEYSRVCGAGARIVLYNPKGKKVFYAIKLELKATNHKAKYVDFINRLKLKHALQDDKVKLKTDFHLIVNHLNGNFLAKGRENEGKPEQSQANGNQISTTHNRAYLEGRELQSRCPC